MDAADPLAHPPRAWRGKALARLSLLLRVGAVIAALAAAIGIGPDGSGTAHLMKQLFADADLRSLDVRLSNHELSEQARLVADSKLDLAAFVMQENAEFLGDIIRTYGLDIVAPQDLQGLVARYPWLSVGRIPAGRYDLVNQVPATVKPVVRLQTLVIAIPCASP